LAKIHTGRPVAFNQVPSGAQIGTGAAVQVI